MKKIKKIFSWLILKIFIKIIYFKNNLNLFNSTYLYMDI